MRLFYSTKRKCFGIYIFFSALCKGPPYRHENGKINWIQLKRLIGSRSLQEVKNFAKNFHALEHGDAYEEFASKAAIDVWKQLAEKTTAKGCFFLLFLNILILIINLFISQLVTLLSPGFLDFHLPNGVF